MSILSPVCPRCMNKARTTRTRFGLRHECCGLRSWDGKPLETPEVMAARTYCHAAFDSLWRTAEEIYEIRERPLTEEYERAVRRIRKAARHRAYAYISFVTGLPEGECHMTVQRDLRKLALIERVARETTPQMVRDWWKRQPERARQ